MGPDTASSLNRLPRQETAFLLLPQARTAWSRCLLTKPIFDDRIALPRQDRPMPWKSIGDQAFKQGSYWIACAAYAKRLEELRVSVRMAEDSDREPETCEEEEVVDISGQRGPDLVPEAAKVLSNRAACLLKVRDHLAAVAHARKAAELAPRWSRAWSRLGQAAWELGEPKEAVSAFAKSVEMEPLPSAVQALESSIKSQQAPNPDAAHAAKEQGNEAIRSGQIGLGIALYTQGIAQLPAPGQGCLFQTASCSIQYHTSCNPNGACLLLRETLPQALRSPTAQTPMRCSGVSCSPTAQRPFPASAAGKLR